MEKKKNPPAQKTNSIAENSLISEEIKNYFTTAKPKHVMFTYFEETDSYILDAYGNREKIRRNVDYTENEKWDKTKEKWTFLMNLIADFFRRIFRGDS